MKISDILWVTLFIALIDDFSRLTNATKTCIDHIFVRKMTTKKIINITQ